jgi:hypothetical protein
MLIEQLAPALIPVPQVLPFVVDKAKLLGDTETVVNVNSAVPELVTVTVCAALVTPTALVKVRVEVERVTAGAVELVVVVLLLPLPPPQAAKKASPISTADKTHRVIEVSVFIAPPPP